MPAGRLSLLGAWRCPPRLAQPQGPGEDAGGCLLPVPELGCFQGCFVTGDFYAVIPALGPGHGNNSRCGPVRNDVARCNGLGG